MKSLVVAPAGPLLSLPFEVLLTGPADAANLADAPWLVRKFTIAHVPAPSNFVSLRKIAAGSRATHPWFGFGDFQPVTPGAGAEDLLRRRLRRQRQAAVEPAAAAVRPQGTGGGACAARAPMPSDELLGPAFTADAVLKARLKDYRILHFSTHALLPSELRCQSEPAIVTSAPAGAPGRIGRAADGVAKWSGSIWMPTW